MAQPRKFGAFAGVFTPSILTILGVIMYLRLPTIVGQAGLWTTVGIILIAHVISVCTGLSVSSIATDKKVKTGGTYYMLSRSLGLPIGGTLGLALFVGLSFGVSLYVIGFSESFLNFWDLDVTKNAIRLTGSITLLVITIVTFISTALALRMQFFVLAAILLSLASIFLGSHAFAPEAPHFSGLPDAAPFIVLFGIFFPAVTGFESGVSMSGDLKDSKKALPSGTIWAIAVGLATYVGMAVFFAYTVSPEQLTNNPNVLTDIALFAPLVVAGIWGATLSSALGAILAAPRILQATSIDRITPKIFAKGSGKDQEPRNALLLAFVIAEAGILIGELDVIARIVSMFFITTYGFLNLSAAIESWVSPDFRPDFKIPKTVSIVGALACFVVMIQLDFVAMIGATIILGALYLYLTRRELTLESGDTWEGVWSSLARAALQRLSTEKVQERNWRPNIILFSGGREARPHLIDFGQQLVYKRGLLSNFDLVVGEADTRLQPRATQAVSAPEQLPWGVFSRRVGCRDVYEGMETIATHYGFSGVEPNTVLMGWARNTAQPKAFGRLLQALTALDYNVLLMDYDKERGFGERKQVDIWWRGAGNNVSLSLALVKFLTTSSAWEQARVRFLIVNEGDTALTDTISQNMHTLLEAERIEADVKVINNVIERRPVREIITLESARADLTFLGIPEVKEQNVEAYVEIVNGLTEVLGTVLLTRASSYFDDLYVGIEPTLSLPAEAVATARPAEAALPALSLPAPEVLAHAVTRLDEHLTAMNTHFADAYLAKLSGLNEALIDAVAAAVAHSFASLEMNLSDTNRPRDRRALHRVESAFLFQARQVLSTFREERLPAQQTFLAGSTSGLQKLVDEVVAKMPETITVIHEPGAFQPAAEDDRYLRLFKLRKRGRAWLTRQPITRQIPFQTMTRTHLARRYPQAILETLKSFAHDSYQTVWDVQKLLHAVSDSLGVIAQVLMSPEGNAPAQISKEKEKAQAQLAVLADVRQQRHAQARWTLAAETRRLVHALSHDVERLDSHRLLRARLRPTREDLERAGQLRGLPQAWAENQAHFLTRAHLDVQLLSLKRRLATIVERARSDLRQNIRLTFIDKLRGLSQDLTDQLTAVDDPMKTTYDFKQPFDDKEVVEALMDDIQAALGELPETVVAVSEEAIHTLEEAPFDRVEVASVSLRRLVGYLIETEFIGLLQEEIAPLPARFRKAGEVAQDVMRLTAFHLGDRALTEDEELVLDDDQRASLIHNGIERITEEEQALETIASQLDVFIDSRLRTTFNQLNPYALTRSEGQLQQYVRLKKQHDALSRLQTLRRRIQTRVSDWLVRLLYRRSEGVLLAQQFQAVRDDHRTTTPDEGLRLLEVVSPRPETLQNLPFYYKQLFLGHPPITRAFWVRRKEALFQAKRAVDSHRQGIQGGLMITGEPLAGKTALSHIIADTYFEKANIYQVDPPEAGSIDPAVFKQRLEQAVQLQGDYDDLFGRLPAGSVLILNDVGLWWERSLHGFAVVDTMLDLMTRYSHQCFFLLNMNLPAWRFINTVKPIADHFLGVVTCTPFNAAQLKEVILLRHRSTGLKFELDGHAEDAVSDWRLAKFFTALFDYSRGNPGVALMAWISQIRKASKAGFTLTTPAAPNLDLLDRLKPVQMALLVQFLLHKRLDETRLLRLTATESAGLAEEISLLRRSGLLVAERDGVLALNAFLQPHLTHAFIERGIL